MGNTVLNIFVNTGLDSNLSKSMNRAGLVQRDIVVNSKHGSYVRKQWVKASDLKDAKAPKKQETKPVKHNSLVSEDYLYLPIGSKSFKTLEQVVEEFHSNESHKKNFGSIDSFIKHKYFVSTGENKTVDLYRIAPGRYTQERFDGVHKGIIDDILESGDSPKTRKPICLLYGGGSGSGKSSVADKWIAEPLMEELGLKFAKVDCDEIKAKLPEHQMFLAQDDMTAAGREHRESSDIANTAIDELIKQGKCFRYDGTMSDTYKYTKLIDRLTANGYEVHIIATDLPVEDALSRASKRARKIDEEIVRKTHRGFGESFLDIATHKGVSSFRLYDNSQPEGQNPTLVADADKIYDNNLWSRFMNKNNQ